MNDISIPAIDMGFASQIMPKYYGETAKSIETAQRKQKRVFAGSQTFFMDEDNGGMSMVEVIAIKGHKEAVRVIETAPIKASGFDMAAFISIAKQAIRSASKKQVTSWGDVGINVYDNADMDTFVRRGVESIISTVARSEKGSNVTINMVMRAMINDFFAAYMVNFIVNHIKQPSVVKSFVKAAKASNDVVSYCFHYMSKDDNKGNDFSAYKADNGFTAYQSAIGKDSIKAFAAVIYGQFVAHSDIIIENEVDAGKSVYSAITINPTIMESIVAKVTASKMSNVTTGYFVNQAIPEVNIGMVMGHASNIIGTEVSVRGFDFNEDIGDTSVIVEAINHNNKAGFVIDQFMADNYDDMAAAIAAAKEVS